MKKKMIKKILLLILIFIVGFGILIFISPETSWKIEKVFWIEWFGESLRNGKKAVDGAITDIPSIEEFKSWAVDIGNKVNNGIQSTKDTIDSIRSGAQKVEDTYNSAKDTIEDVKNTYDNAVETFSWAADKLHEVQWVIESVSNLTNSEK